MFRTDTILDCMLAKQGDSTVRITSLLHPCGTLFHQTNSSTIGKMELLTVFLWEVNMMHSDRHQNWSPLSTFFWIPIMASIKLPDIENNTISKPLETRRSLTHVPTLPHVSIIQCQ